MLVTSCTLSNTHSIKESYPLRQILSDVADSAHDGVDVALESELAHGLFHVQMLICSGEDVSERIAHSC